MAAIFATDHDLTFDSGLVITVLVIIVLVLGVLWLWRHR